MYSLVKGSVKTAAVVAAAEVVSLLLLTLMFALVGCGGGKYESSVIENWKTLKEKGDQLVETLNETETVDDFEQLNTVATQTRDFIDSLYDEEKGKSAPAGFEELKSKEIKALESMVEYLDLVVEMAEKTKAEQFEEEKELIETRARKALSDVNDFIDAAEFLNIAISADFFNAAAKMENAINYRGEEYEKQAEQALQTLETFMKADIDELNADLLWELASSRRKEVMIVLGGAKENMAAYHAAQWGDIAPTSYFINDDGIEISPEGVVSIPVIVYAKNESPMDSHVELILEPEGWKVDVYPWLGWLAE